MATMGMPTMGQSPGPVLAAVKDSVLRQDRVSGPVRDCTSLCPAAERRENSDQPPMACAADRLCPALLHTQGARARTGREKKEERRGGARCHSDGGIRLGPGPPSSRNSSSPKGSSNSASFDNCGTRCPQNPAYLVNRSGTPSGCGSARIWHARRSRPEVNAENGGRENRARSIALG